MLHKLHSTLRHSGSMSPDDTLAIWGAFTLAFHDFLRVGKFTTTTTYKFSPTLHLLRRDICVKLGSLTITIEASKADPVEPPALCQPLRHTPQPARSGPWDSSSEQQASLHGLFRQQADGRTQPTSDTFAHQ